MSIWILDVATDAGSLDAFLELPAEVYRDLPRSGAPSPSAVQARLLCERFRGARRVLVALENGRPAARVVARISPTLRDEAGCPIGMLGEFEACPCPDAVATLFADARRWFERRGVRVIVGPMDGDTWHRYRINAGPFARAPFHREPFNPPYYADLWERAGFRATESYYSAYVPDVTEALPKLGWMARRALGRGYRLRRLDKSRLHWELKAIHEISRELFRRHAFYTDISWWEFLALKRELVPLLDPDLVWFAEDWSGNTCGFLFAYPDPENGRTVNYETVGVLPGHRRRGVCAALVQRGYEAAARKGLRRGNLCLLREGKPAGRFDTGCGRVFRRYRLYERRGDRVYFDRRRRASARSSVRS
jgi:GNAT superfamily N-acetyltransferase